MGLSLITQLGETRAWARSGTRHHVTVRTEMVVHLANQKQLC
jgi:hypothetical protein